MSLKETRESFGISQAAAASTIGMPLRTYVRYESDENYGNELKRQSMVAALNDAYKITETKGLYTIEQIKTKIAMVINDEYKDTVEFCYLFGSYAKGYAKESSDVDLCVSTSLSGLKYVGLAESLRIALNKKVDLVRLSDLSNNVGLVNEIMKDGIKIYG
ncbi:MAG: nucleotidyltransferase domain-containing protein [Bacilli bacterium]|nr:nucleotidyltransferase domain-containing protein [Bacilli bacterium]